MEEIKTAKCILEDNDRKYTITVELHYNKEDITDEGELFFRHVITNQLCNTAQQALQGWSEQNKEDNENWQYLVNCIIEDDMLIQKIFDDVEIIKYYK